MSDETTPPSEEVAAESEPKPKVRRISNKNPRKAAKSTKEEQPPEEQAVPIEEFDSTPPAGASESEEKEDAAGDQKRKNNRRRRGKGKSSQKDAESSDADSPVSEETTDLVDSDSKDSNQRKEKHGNRGDQQNQRPGQKQRPKLDSDKVAKNAWKIFLAEVSEEGVALIGDNDARELARRCFRLSEIFLEEESRRN